MAINPCLTNNFIDSCAFDPKYEPETTASVEIFRLSLKGKLLIHIAHSTQKEIEHPNTPDLVKQKAQNLIYTLDVSLTSNEINKLREIEAILAGNGKIENILQDARHVFEAQKHGSYFVTTDSRILNRAEVLCSACGVIILKPSEFLSLVNQCISKGDDRQADVHSLKNQIAAPRPQAVSQMKAVPYKGYVIEATPYQLSDSMEWTINIYIRRDTGEQITFRNFSATNTFKTKDEAIQHCIDFGRRIIDGEISNCTVSDL